MPSYTRNVILLIVVVATLVGTAWAILGGGLPPADFTFVNSTEIKSVDPALITGQPEGRIVDAVFEGLVRWHPETLEPLPGVARSWDISDDLLVYTFHLRKDARWSDGSPVTAHDFLYSWRRFLDPRTAAEYAYQAWYLQNAKRYSMGASGIQAGDPVEVELNLPVGATNTLRGEVIYGTLVSKEIDEANNSREFVVEVAGQEERFRAVGDQLADGNAAPEGVRWCRQVLLDFREVGVQAIDEHTLKVTLENPAPYFLSLTGFYPLFPVNQQCVEKHGSPGWIKPDNLICNGPYLIEFRRIRDRIRLVKNPIYWNRENVRLERIDALAIESTTTALNLFMTGKVDWIPDVPPPALRILLNEDPPRNDLNPAPYLSSYFYLINTNRYPLNDRRVRLALSMALDREEITTKILAAGEIPALSLVPPGIPGYESQQSYPEDPEEARRLLADAGFPDGKGFPRLEILYNTHESHQSIAELIRKQWQRELGIAVKTRNEEWGSYLASQRQMQYDIGRKGWIGDYTDPNTFLDMFVTGGEQNNTGWSNPRYDQLIEQARSEADDEKRLEMLAEAEAILMEELPILPVYHYVSKNMVKPHVRGFYNNIRDIHPLWAIWIDRESPGPNEFMKGSQ